MRALLARFGYEGNDAQTVGRPDPRLVGRPAHLREDDLAELPPSPILCHPNTRLAADLRYHQQA